MRSCNVHSGKWTLTFAFRSPRSLRARRRGPKPARRPERRGRPTSATWAAGTLLALACVLPRYLPRQLDYGVMALKILLVEVGREPEPQLLGYSRHPSVAAYLC